MTRDRIMGNIFDICHSSMQTVYPTDCTDEVVQKAMYNEGIRRYVEELTACLTCTPEDETDFDILKKLLSRQKVTDETVLKDPDNQVITLTAGNTEGKINFVFDENGRLLTF